MLRNLNILSKYSIRAKDGPIGEIEDFYFDDIRWTIRYLVLDTGHWLPGRLVLISPASVHLWDSDLVELQVDLTCEQIKNSPPVSAHKPVSLQAEEELSHYFGWPAYWGTLQPIVYPVPAVDLTKEEGAAEPKEKIKKEGRHLRSVNEVTGYHIEARDGGIGHVEDFIVEIQSWKIRSIVVDTRNWLPGKKVTIPPSRIEKVSWPDSKVYVDLTRENVKHSPEFHFEESDLRKSA